MARRNRRKKKTKGTPTRKPIGLDCSRLLDYSSLLDYLHYDIFEVDHSETSKPRKKSKTRGTKTRKPIGLDYSRILDYRCSRLDYCNSSFDVDH